VDAPPLPLLPLPPLPLPPPPQAASTTQNATPTQTRSRAALRSSPGNFRIFGGNMTLSYWYHSRTSFSIILQTGCPIVIQ
jgi:hypothetical protein